MVVDHGRVNAAGAATFAWAAIACSAPFLFNTFTVYPEIAAALAVMVALVTTRDDQHRRDRALARWLAVGVACATLPWLSTKYAPMSAALVLVAIGRLGRNWNLLPHHARNSESLGACVALYALSLAGWFAFFYAIWGIPLPMAPYGALVQTSPLNLVFGAPGLLFDQEYGLLAFAPVYVLAATGLYQMWRAGGESRRQAIEITLVFGALLAHGRRLPHLVGRHAGAGAAARVGAAAAGAADRDGVPRGPGRFGAARGPAPVAVDQHRHRHHARDRAGRLPDQQRPRRHLVAAGVLVAAMGAVDAGAHASSSAKAIAWLHTLWWLAIAGGAAVLLSRSRATAGAAALAAITTLRGGVAASSRITFPLLPAGAPMPRVDLGARSRLATLDGFDARVRPAAIIYDPLRKVRGGRRAAEVRSA